VAVVGDKKVGKTSLILALMDQAFRETYTATPCCDLFCRQLGTDGAWMDVWDTNGDDTDLECAEMFISRATVVLVVFDVCWTPSFVACDRWIQTVRQRIAGATIVVVGAQCDRVTERRVPAEFALGAVGGWDTPYVELSSKSGENLQALVALLEKSLPGS